MGGSWHAKMASALAPFSFGWQDFHENKARVGILLLTIACLQKFQSKTLSPEIYRDALIIRWAVIDWLEAEKVTQNYNNI